MLNLDTHGLFRICHMACMAGGQLKRGASMGLDVAIQTFAPGRQEPIRDHGRIPGGPVHAGHASDLLGQDAGPPMKLVDVGPSIGFYTLGECRN